MTIKNSWYYFTAEQVLKELDTNIATGLGKAEARQRLDSHGPNRLLEKPPKSPWLLLLEQFKGI